MINNRTADKTIENCSLNTRPSSGGRTEQVRIAVTIPPGSTHQFSVKPGNYKVYCFGKPEKATGSMGQLGGPLFSHDEWEDVSGPTEFMVYDGATPPAPATPGARLVAEVSRTERARRSKADQDQRHKDAEARCEKHRTRPQQPSRPGRVKLSGKWQCVLGGGARGTNWITFAQLANGRVTATVVGVDRDTVLEGAVDGDALHFTMTNGAAGTLTIDPGGRAMTGVGSTLSNGACSEWTLTCTR